MREELLNLGVQSIFSVRHPWTLYGPPVSPSRRDNMPPRFHCRLADEWRTPDDRPICFNCRRVCDVARYWQSRSFPPRQNNCDRYPDDPVPRRFYSRRPPQPNTADSIHNRWSWSFRIAAASPVPFCSSLLLADTADQLRETLPGKLEDAAPGGNAAFSDRPKNPLTTLPAEKNLLDVKVYAVDVSALIDTGAQVSVVSAKLRCLR